MVIDGESPHCLCLFHLFPFFHCTRMTRHVLGSQFNRLDKLKASKIRSIMKPPNGDLWRSNSLREVCMTRSGAASILNFWNSCSQDNQKNWENSQDSKILRIFLRNSDLTMGSGSNIVMHMIFTQQDGWMMDDQPPPGNHPVFLLTARHRSGHPRVAQQGVPSRDQVSPATAGRLLITSKVSSQPGNGGKTLLGEEVWDFPHKKWETKCNQGKIIKMKTKQTASLDKGTDSLKIHSFEGRSWNFQLHSNKLQHLCSRSYISLPSYDWWLAISRNHLSNSIQLNKTCHDTCNPFLLQTRNHTASDS